MARKSKVNYWESRGCFGCTIRGQQHELAQGPNDEESRGPVYQAAVMKFTRLMMGRSDDDTFAAVAEKYLRFNAANRAGGTHRIRKRYLELAVESLGEKAADGISQQVVLDWLDREQQQRGWGNTVRAMAGNAVRAALKWAVKTGLLRSHGLAGLEVPKPDARGRHAAIAAELVPLAVSSAPPIARSIVQALFQTGARPGELIAAEARYYDPDLRAIVYSGHPRPGDFRHKTVRTEKDRVIFLSGDTLATVQELMARYPTGPLFRTSNRGPRRPGIRRQPGWTENALTKAFAAIRRRTGIRGLVPYSGRHTFAVQWLRARRPIGFLAEVLGTSIKDIVETYGRLADQTDLLRNLVDEQVAAMEVKK